MKTASAISTELHAGEASSTVTRSNALHQLKAKLAYLKTIKDYRLCEQSFYHFVKSAWPIVNPGKPFQDNWHIKVICDHLEACYRREILRLIINVPYRSSKSNTVSVLFPVWVWIQDPTQVFLTLSHNGNLAKRDSLASLRLLRSEWFRAYWGEKVKLQADQQEKRNYETTQRGVRQASGLESGIQGANADFLIIDDPHDAKSAMYSTAERTTACNTFDQEVSTRLNEPKRSVIIVIMQRLHQKDLSGHVMMKNPGLWVHLRIPFKYEANNPCITPLGKVDPRTKDGEFYWPARFDQAWYDEQAKNLGTWGVAGQLQQRPAPEGGGLCNLEWFKRYKVLPAKEHWTRVVQFWDTAQNKDELLNSPWVCMTVVQVGNLKYVKHVFRRWMNYPEGKRIVASLGQREHVNFAVIEKASTGASLIQELQGQCGFPLKGMLPEKDKVTRFGVESPAIEAGEVYLPETAPWLPEYEGELVLFPASEYKDQSDVTSMMLRFFRTGIREPRARWAG